MILEIPLAVWFGILTIIGLFITLCLGITKQMKYHKFFAFLTGVLALIHLVFAYLLWFKGIAI